MDGHRHFTLELSELTFLSAAISRAALDARILADRICSNSSSVEAHAEMGVEIAALGTSPLPVEAQISPSVRFDQMADRFGLTAREQLTCGCHAHVGVCSDEEGVAVLDRIRPWLAPLRTRAGSRSHRRPPLAAPWTSRVSGRHLPPNAAPFPGRAAPGW